MAANCAGDGGTPGGAGGNKGCPTPSNLAPASNPFYNGKHYNYHRSNLI